MSDFLKKIKTVLSLLESHGFIKSLDRIDVFYDEPRFYKYVALLNFSKKNFGSRTILKTTVASGYSLTSKYTALIRCLGESMERLSLYIFKKENILSLKKNILTPKIINLKYYPKSNAVDIEKLGWVKGKNLTKNRLVLIPAQLIYLNYLRTYSEKPLSTSISTGAAGGFVEEETLLRGIYEIIERDCFMTMYLNKIKPRRIKLRSLNHKTIKAIKNSLARYRLELFVFDITNDLTVPCFMTVIIDRTGFVPILTLGLKSSLDPHAAIIGSIEEALSGRSLKRNLTTNNRTGALWIDPKRIKTKEQRALYWLNPKVIQSLDIWFKQKEINLTIKRFSKIPEEELAFVIYMLKTKGFEIFFSDIALSVFKNINYFIYKVIIPGLQPLYLDETRKEVNIFRLQAVAKYFGLKDYNLNSVPHPFL